MPYLFLLISLILASNQEKMGFHDFKLKAIDGKEIDFDQYKGKKVLLVNVASACGYTPQYEDLQMLSNQFGHQVVVIGIPANNFGGQEPGSNAEIQAFCKANYGVTFQMMEKISVEGKDQHPLYKWLAAESGKVPNWNFCKFLISEKGEVLGFFPSSVNPLEEVITSKL